MASGRHPTWTGILFRSKILEQIGFLDPQVGPFIDLDFQLRVAAHFPYLISKKKCAIFLNHPHAYSANIKEEFVPSWENLIMNTAHLPVPLAARQQVAHLLFKALKEALSSNLKKSLKKKIL